MLMCMLTQKGMCYVFRVNGRVQICSYRIPTPLIGDTKLGEGAASTWSEKGVRPEPRDTDDRLPAIVATINGYWETPLWRACLALDTDGMVDAPQRH
jgi:hypothetical protein